MVLRRVGEAVQQEVDEQQEQPVQGAPTVDRGGPLLGRARVVESEGRDAQGDQQDDSVFVQRVALPEEGDVEEHHRQQFTGLGQYEGQIVDVAETGVAERRRQRRGDADDDQREQDLPVGEDRGHLLALGRREVQI